MQDRIWRRLDDDMASFGDGVPLFITLLPVRLGASFVV